MNESKIQMDKREEMNKTIHNIDIIVKKIRSKNLEQVINDIDNNTV